MNQDTAKIHSAIVDAFENLYDYDSPNYDFWVSELYDSKHEPILSEWNEINLNKMEDDVMQAIQESD